MEDHCPLRHHSAMIAMVSALAFRTSALMDERQGEEEAVSVSDPNTGAPFAAQATSGQADAPEAEGAKTGAQSHDFPAKTKAAGIVNIRPVFLDLEDPAATPPTVAALVSSMTLHHVRDIPRLARIFFSMLHAGGHIALADLATEAGDFHPDNTGVHHFGFDADWLRATFATAGFANARTTLAHTVRKQLASGETKDFPILLLTADKP